MRDELAKLKDIKPPVEVPDFSFWLFVGLITILILSLFVLILFKFKKRIKRRKRFDIKVEAREKLSRIDFTDSKKAVYTFDEYLPILIGDNLELMQEFESLQRDLEKYKYKRDVPKLDKKDIIKMKTMIKRGFKWN